MSYLECTTCGNVGAQRVTTLDRPIYIRNIQSIERAMHLDFNCSIFRVSFPIKSGEILKIVMLCQ